MHKAFYRTAVIGLAALGTLQAQTEPGKVDFARDVQPVFAKSCYGCHGPKVQMGGLRLDSKKLAAQLKVLSGNVAAFVKQHGG